MGKPIARSEACCDKRQAPQLKSSGAKSTKERDAYPRCLRVRVGEEARPRLEMESVHQLGVMQLC